MSIGTYANVARVVENVTRRTFALVSSWNVNANAVEAHVRTQLVALVYVLAHLVLRVVSHARRTNALRAKYNDVDAIVILLITRTSFFEERSNESLKNLPGNYRVCCDTGRRCTENPPARTR